MRPRLLGTTLLMAALLSACSGGSSGKDDSPSDAYAQQCSIHNPYRADALQATTVGDLSTEKRWGRAYLDEKYLWYNSIQNRDPNEPAFSDDTDSGFLNSLESYFLTLTRGSEPPRDHFSFVASTKQYNQSTQSGVDVSSGANWVLMSTPGVKPRDIRVALVHPNTPAANAGLQRGDVLVSVNGFLAASDTSDEGIAALQGLLNGTQGPASYSVVVKRGDVEQAAVTVATQALELNPVPTVQVLPQADGSQVGYLLFNDFNAVAETRLINAVTQFQQAGVQDLVLDLRYNGGGYVYIANILASMIAGADQTSGKIFQKFQYNDQRGDETEASKLAFARTSCQPNFDTGRCTSTQTLPTLNLKRLYVLTTDDTCSASEAVINGLAGVDVQVQRIGTTTCGKPYGFTGHDNCGVSYFPIEFQIANHKGFGDYAEGIVPTCEVADDLVHALGDPAEAQLATALSLRNTGSCPATSSNVALSTRQRTAALDATATPVSPLSRPSYKSGLNGWQPRSPAN